MPIRRSSENQENYPQPNIKVDKEHEHALEKVWKVSNRCKDAQIHNKINAKLKWDSIQLAKTKPFLQIYYFSRDGKIGKLSYFVGRYLAHRRFENIH